MTRLYRLTIHPFLLAALPIVFLYNHNLRTHPISAVELLIPLGISLGFTLTVWLLLSWSLHHPIKAGIVTSLFLILFFLYGHVFMALNHKLARHEYLGLTWLALLLAGVTLTVRAQRNLIGLNLFLNLLGIAILLTNLAGLLPALFALCRKKGTAVQTERERIPANGQDTTRPDIYYIILDGYARSDVLQSEYGLDNTQFIRALEDLGFRVAQYSRSNYSQTHLSLASSLNFSYLDSLVERQGAESGNRAGLIRMIQDSRVAHILRQHGYQLVNFASGYEGVGLKNADRQLGPRWALSEFQNVLISTTPLPILLDWVSPRNQYDLHRDRILYTLNNLPAIAHGQHPVFVFAHIAGAHPPFVLGANGEKVRPAGYFRMTDGGDFCTVERQKVLEEYVAGYGRQLRFINLKILEVVKRILDNSPQPPVIILQGDHGAGSVLNWDEPDWSEIPARLAILNALYAPFELGFYDSITPVNTFRLIFNHLFATGFPLLPDRSYFSTITRPFRFYDLDHPEQYSLNGEAIAVVAFPCCVNPPVSPPTYCRQLVTTKYRDLAKRIVSFYVRNVSNLLTAAEAYELYQNYVRAGTLPDLGQECEIYEGIGPERIPVVALFFRVTNH